MTIKELEEASERRRRRARILWGILLCLNAIGMATAAYIVIHFLQKWW